MCNEIHLIKGIKSEYVKIAEMEKKKRVVDDGKLGYNNNKKYKSGNTCLLTCQVNNRLPPSIKKQGLLVTVGTTINSC